MDDFGNYYSTCAQVIILSWLILVVETRALTHIAQVRPFTVYLGLLFLVQAGISTLLCIAVLGGVVPDSVPVRLAVLSASANALMVAFLGLYKKMFVETGAMGSRVRK